MGAIAVALSGLQASSLQLDVAASNVANLNTPGFQPSRVDLAEAAGGGVSARVVPGPAPAVVPGTPPDQVPSGTDLVDQVATMIAAPLAYSANARVIDVADRMTSHLFNAYV